MSFFSLGNKDGGDSNTASGGSGGGGGDSVDIFPDEYTIQKHIGNAWAGDPLSQAKAVK